ncbi:MAG: hypothetical protein ACI87Q_000865 [Pseudohongiellaceae bacterium]|jgi:hypothetical protein
MINGKGCLAEIKGIILRLIGARYLRDIHLIEFPYIFYIHTEAPTLIRCARNKMASLVGPLLIIERPTQGVPYPLVNIDVVSFVRREDLENDFL